MTLDSRRDRHSDSGDKKTRLRVYFVLKEPERLQEYSPVFIKFTSATRSHGVSITDYLLVTYYFLQNRASHHAAGESSDCDTEMG